jgi:hypothetical protein
VRLLLRRYTVFVDFLGKLLVKCLGSPKTRGVE